MNTNQPKGSTPIGGQTVELKRRLLLSFSGGETSGFMTQWCLANMSDRYEMRVVFANTGYENEETLIFVDECSRHFGFDCEWVEARTNPKHGKGVFGQRVNFQTASRNAEPFRDMVAKHGIPNKNFPHCSRELKNRAIRNYIKHTGWSDYYTAIGIREDEFDRISESRKADKLIYPLIVGCPMRKQGINAYWHKMPFRLRLKGYQGNCKVCWKKSLRKLLTIAKENPEAFIPFQEMEAEFENYSPETRISKPNFPIRFFRGNLSVSQILEMSKGEFEPAVDDAIAVPIYKQTLLFGNEMDVSFGCTESCEVFSNQPT